MQDLISRQEAIDEVVAWLKDRMTDGKNGKPLTERLKDLPPAQPQYTELTPEEAALEISSGSIMSAWYWLDDMMRLKQMGYAICRKKG